MGVLPGGVGERPGSKSEPGSDWSACRLRLRNGRASWLDRAGRVAVRAEGLALALSPFAVPGRTLAHCDLQVEEVTVEGRPLRTGIALEFIRAGDHVLSLPGATKPAASTRPASATGDEGARLPSAAEDEDLAEALRSALREALDGAGDSVAAD